MYLSELYGRIGQILREHGDMKVQRYRSLKIDGIVGNIFNNLVDYNSDDFIVFYDYTQIDKNKVEPKKVGQHFVINIPF